MHGPLRPMPRLGLALAHGGRFADPDAIREMARRTEAAGFSSLWAMDRLLAPVTPRNPYPASTDGLLPPEQHVVFDPLVALTIAAEQTSTVRLGTNVLVAPWYPPILLARTLTGIDLASAGRLVVGLGLGWSIDEFEAVGASLTGLGRQMEETLDVLATVWADGVGSYRGERYHLVPADVRPKPVQRPRPPILLAAYTPSGLDRVARRADGWTPAGLPVEALAPMFSTVRDLAAGHGRDPDTLELVVRANCHVTERTAGPDRPTYHGSIEQIATDLVRTADAGVHEIVVEVTGSSGSLDELFDLAAAVTSPLAAAVPV